MDASPTVADLDDASAVLKLSDGRQLGYADYGSSTAPAILYFMGWPASRLEGALWSDVAKTVEARIIAIDRPGIGLSSPQPDRTILSFADDVVELADHLHLDEFRILGVSGGGPYALACAKSLTKDRLKAVGIVAGFGPLYLTGKIGMGFGQRLTWTVLEWMPFVIRPFIDWMLLPAARDPDPDVFKRTVMQGLSGMPEPDLEALKHDFIADGIVASMKEAFRQGSEGLAYEGRLLAGKWPFSLSEIGFEGLMMWYGSEDQNCPLDMGRKMADEMIGVDFKAFEGEAHLSIEANHAEEILRSLLAKK